MHAQRLSENRDFLDGLRQAALDGKFIYAECGGLMTLCESIVNGEEHPMAGVFPCKAELTGGRQGLSYVRARGTAFNPFFPDMDVRGHEFHYSRLIPAPSGPFGYDVERGTGIDGSHDGLVRNNVLGCYMHQHALSRLDWGIRMTEAASN